MPQCLAPEPFLVITAPYGLTLRAAFTVWQRGGLLMEWGGVGESVLVEGGWW